MPRRLVQLTVVAVGVAATLFGVGPAHVQRARAEPPPKKLECGCDDGFGACQHFLRNPKGPTADPCWCDRCDTGAAGKRHDGKTLPPGWSEVCFKSKRLDCYLKRHAAAWGIACSECIRLDDCCGSKNEANCPDCDESTAGPPVAKDSRGLDVKATVAEHLAKEQARFKKPKDVILAYDRNFYVVTDVEGLKVRMPGGKRRPISKHEWIHLTIERAEWCRREWVRALGEPELAPPKQTGEPREPTMPMGIYVCAKERDKEKIAAAHFASPNATYIFGNASRPADGFCMTAMGFSEERVGGDHNIQIEIRHQLTHNFLSVWGEHDTRPGSFPQWVYEGLAHWMTRMGSPFDDDATWCVPEGAKSGVGKTSGKDWDKDVVRLAASRKLDPIEKLLAKTVKGGLTQDDHRRSWSLVTLGIEEIGQPFVELLRDLRKQRDVREAFVERLGMTPDELDRRWRERVAGKRESLGDERPAAADSSAGSEDENSPAARERASIRGEQDPRALAAKIRQLGAIGDPQMVDLVIDALARKSDLIRENALVTLLATQDEACRRRISDFGLAHKDGVARAYAARACGRLGLVDAAPQLVLQLADTNWYARAEAAVALGLLHHQEARSPIRKMVTSDPSEKARLAAMDALASFGGDAEMSAPLIAKHLSSPRWQLRVAACQALGAIGSMESVDPLIARMEVETGRVRREIRAALTAITHDDLGAKPEHWRTWWDAERAKHPGALPPRPDGTATTGPPQEPEEPEDDRYAEQEYYGIELVSDRVAFVVDVSKSMALLFEPDPSAARLLSREYTGSDKLTICHEEVAQTLEALDARSHFMVVTFGTRVASSEPHPVPANTRNVKSALAFLRAIPAEGETNYYDALRAVLGAGDEPDVSPKFRSTPDTISFLTDGEPTAGDITDAGTLAEWYAGLNRYARIKTHTITFGLNRVDQQLLQRLAEQNWGKYILVPER